MSEPPLHAGPDGAEARPRKTGQARLDLVLAISAVFISGVSLYVAIEHGKTERDLVAANSWPILRAAIDDQQGADKDLVFGFSNGGVGPAKVITYEVFYRGASVATPLDLLRRCCGLSSDATEEKRQIGDAFVTAKASDEVLRPGEDLIAFELRRRIADPTIVARFDDTLRGAATGQLAFRACYCSVFDQCWTTRLTSVETTSVKVCPKPKVPFDPNGRS